MAMLKLREFLKERKGIFLIKQEPCFTIADNQPHSVCDGLSLWVHP